MHVHVYMYMVSVVFGTAIPTCLYIFNLQCTCTRRVINPWHTCTARVTVVVLCVCVCVSVSVSPHTILVVCANTSKTKDTIMLSVEFEAIIKAFFLKMSGSKVRVLLLTSAGTAILSSCAIYVQCFLYSPLHVLLCVTHTLSYGDKGHLYDCACVRGGPS